MPRYFICEAGPMGGCNIIAVADERADINRMLDALRKNSDANRELFVYEQLSQTITD